MDYDFVMDMEPRISEEVNPLGKRRYAVQWFSRSGKRPEPYSWSFKSRRKAERWVAQRQKQLLDLAFRVDPS